MEAAWGINLTQKYLFFFVFEANDDDDDDDEKFVSWLSMKRQQSHQELVHVRQTFSSYNR